MATPGSVRDLFAHVIQLCDYVEDMRCEPLLTTTDYDVLRAKAKQVRTIVMEKSK